MTDELPPSSAHPFVLVSAAPVAVPGVVGADEAIAVIREHHARWAAAPRDRP